MSWSYIDWAEKAGIECLKGRLETAAFLQKEATTLLSILLVGIGGGLGYAVKLLDGQSGTPLFAGMAISTGWLCAVAMVLMTKCITTTNTELLYNLPLNIYLPESNLSEIQIREAEMENVHGRIESMLRMNDERAKWLDRARYGAISTPIVFLVVVLAVVCAPAVAGR